MNPVLLALAWGLFAIAVAAPALASLFPLGPSKALASLPLWGETAALAAAATVLTTLLGLPVGWALARGRIPRFLLGLVLAQAALPTALGSIGWIAAFGSQGLLPLPFLYTPAGVALVWVFSFWPLPALATWSGLKLAEASQEEALLLSLPRWKVACRFTLLRALPVTLCGSAAAWILMMGDLGVPGSLMVHLGAESVHAYTAMTWDLAGAAGMTLPLLLPAAALGILAWKAIASRTMAGDPRGAFPLGSLNAFAWGLVPLSLLVPTSGLASWALQGGGWKGVGVLAPEASRTLLLSVATGGLCALGAFAMARTLQGRPRLAALAAVLSLLAFALPGTLIGTGLIRLWNAPGWRGAVYTSGGILLLACLARAFAIPFLLVWRAILSLPPSLDEAARLSNLPAWKRAWEIQLPLCRGSLVAGGLLAATVAAGEVAASTLVSPPGQQTLAPRLFSLVHFGADAAVGCAALIGMGAVVFAGFVMARTR